MRTIATVVVQLVASLLLVGALMPAFIVAVPAARTRHAGAVVVFVGVGITFGLIRLVWPKRRR